MVQAKKILGTDENLGLSQYYSEYDDENNNYDDDVNILPERSQQKSLHSGFVSSTSSSSTSRSGGDDGPNIDGVAYDDDVDIRPMKSKHNGATSYKGEEIPDKWHASHHLPHHNKSGKDAAPQQSPHGKHDSWNNTKHIDHRYTF